MKRVKSETVRMWEKLIVAYFRYHPGIFMEGMRKHTKQFGQNSWGPGPDSKRALSKCKSQASSFGNSLQGHEPECRTLPLPIIQSSVMLSSTTFIFLPLFSCVR
jgi:hypothetical protein